MTMNVVTTARTSVARSVRRSVNPNHHAREAPAMRAAAVYHRRAPGRRGLQRAEEVQQILLAALRQRVESLDDRVGLRCPVLRVPRAPVGADGRDQVRRTPVVQEEDPLAEPPERDRKSTRLNSSHLVISYAVFCLKKKKKKPNSQNKEKNKTTQKKKKN